LSAGKAGTILALAEQIDSGLLAEAFLGTAGHEELQQRLSAIRGIGPWTVQMFAIFHRGFPDVFPPGDLGIRRAVGNLTGSRTPLSPDRAEEVATRWRPYRTVATWYLWRSLGTKMIGDA
jgi:3-methyladenine DNA glycosylase/8-oxoguanine DNA glycosylase